VGYKSIQDFLAAEIAEPYDSDELQLLTLQESWADCSRALRTGYRARLKPDSVSVRCGSLAQVSAEIDVYREDFQAGSRVALIDALRTACVENVPLPYWAADGILAALAELNANPAATLHSVFGMGKRYPTSKKKAVKERAEWKVKQRLYMRASLLIAHENMGKVAAIKKAIADERLPVGFRNAFAWFNEMDDLHQRHRRAWHGIKLHKLR
jgi:hypothetical protein